MHIVETNEIASKIQLQSEYFEKVQLSKCIYLLEIFKRLPALIIDLEKVTHWVPAEQNKSAA